MSQVGPLADLNGFEKIMLQILVSGKFIYIVLFHKQACHRALCREQRIINAGMSGRLNKSDRTGNRIEHWQKEMAQYC